jgi:dUTP pyrophosphatase
MMILFEGVAPTQANPHDAGYDLRAIGHATIPPGGRALIKIGLRMAIPEGYAGLVCSRSGLAVKHGVFVLNAPGILDSGYRGEVGVILQNLGEEYFDINHGDRIAQLLIVKADQPLFLPGILNETSRGEGGFGSTGK